MNNSFSRLAAVMGATCLLPLSVFAQMSKEAIGPQPTTAVAPKAVTIHQEVDFKASPARVYQALLDTKQFCQFAAVAGEFSAKSAQIDPTEGGAFTLFDGHIIGRNVELVPNQRIVQAWRVVDWPAGVYSIARFELKAQGSGTHLVFDQTGFPENRRDPLAAGWQSHYWDLLAKYLR